MYLRASADALGVLPGGGLTVIVRPAGCCFWAQTGSAGRAFPFVAVVLVKGEFLAGDAGCAHAPGRDLEERGNFFGAEVSAFDRTLHPD